MNVDFKIINLQIGLEIALFSKLEHLKFIGLIKHYDVPFSFSYGTKLSEKNLPLRNR